MSDLEKEIEKFIRENRHSKLTIEDHSFGFRITATRGLFTSVDDSCGFSTGNDLLECTKEAINHLKSSVGENIKRGIKKLNTKTDNLEKEIEQVNKKKLELAQQLEDFYSKKVLEWMNRNKNDYVECGELNCTKIAEDAADHFVLLEGDNEDVPEWIFEMAAKIE